MHLSVKKLLTLSLAHLKVTVKTVAKKHDQTSKETVFLSVSSLYSL